MAVSEGGEALGGCLTNRSSTPCAWRLAPDRKTSGHRLFGKEEVEGALDALASPRPV